ncbi:phosphate acetyltransferase [Clostridium acetireducens DSM 10703]|jgi:phosphate butyryltransferase|uniref:Phosphate acetyltransferase n=1 Tax=Clostridium acetireducens DSM 10703 TaxID=1121290 RepID=A0A1E8EYK4_9CLOT|nr:bifunctional enoyl-CoA hydratase/phosphate acetyltransferase [Clostridium acetireducens]OFI05776.1 phosphate acetyltransferase [Clostridium acetireducens DSM 10703]
MVTRLKELASILEKKHKKTLAVAVAQDKDVLKAVFKAVELNIIDAILVGDKEEIINICNENGLNEINVVIVDEKDKLKATAKAVELVSKGKAQFIMKGMIGTAPLLKAVLNKEAGLRGNNLLSHVMIYDVPSYHKLLFLTDGGMVTYPDLDEKVGIIKNTLKVTKALGIEKPKIAPVCAVEVVNSSMQDTIDAASLTLMNKRGQIKDCIIEGPLGLDNAISKEAAEHKGIDSKIAGDVDVLLVPNIVAGNFLGKGMSYFAGAENAGVIMGAKCPIVLVSRADSAKSKLYAIALGSIVSGS